MKAFLIEWSQDRIWPKDNDNGTPASVKPDFEIIRQQIASMSMQEFARSGLVVTVDSSALGECVLFASDNTDVIEQGSGLIVYRAAELIQLSGMMVEQLRKIHVLKKTFRATIEFVGQK